MESNACGVSKLYLKVLGAWFGGRRDGGEEEGVGGPPAPPLGGK